MRLNGEKAIDLLDLGISALREVLADDSAVLEMPSYYSGLGSGGDTSRRDYPLFDYWRKPICGTSACAGGWMYACPEMPDLGQRDVRFWALEYSLLVDIPFNDIFGPSLGQEETKEQTLTKIIGRLQYRRDKWALSLGYAV